jgi:competence protein ComEA
MRKSFVTGILLPLLTLAASQDKPGSSSDEKGKALAQRICTSCHEMDTVTAIRRTELGWRENVEEMANRGAEGSEQELAEVVGYLTRYVGKLNVNTASARQLEDFLGFTEAEAKALASWRDRNGNLKNFEQLQGVPNIDPAKLQEKRNLIAFSQ